MSILAIEDLHVSVTTDAGPREILRGVTLTVESGSTHAVMGPNGSGKSTLANAIMGHPSLDVTEGEIEFDGENITEAAPDERSRAGLFMAFQYPVAVPGVTVAKYLRMIVNTHRDARGEPEIKLREFAKTTKEAMALMEVPADFNSRYLNDGFSGGEKKRMELLQLALLKPQIAVLDESEQREYLEAIGLEEPGLNRVIRAGYKLLKLLTYFTVGPKEARAWTITAGTRAPAAAGVIHTDFEKGFIRAETIAYNDYVSLGGEAGARDAGKMRLEGKEYVVADGDVMHFRFNT